MQSDVEYLALARKYRPQVFEDVVGQEHVLKALAHSIDAGKTHHAYVFTGTRGIGKTTIARIFAKSLECTSQDKPTSHPCGQCDACKAIANGSFPDVIEIDAASQTKVEDTRQILENTQYPPINARYKIYIIDEVHMLTTNSFNALLKTLEEPPAYVKFILATTDPHKIPTTVLSRCLQFPLRALSIDQICSQLQKICELEHIEFEQDALLTLARAARGSMRDALSLCDQAIALGNGKLEQSNIQAMLGTVGDELTAQILELLSLPKDTKKDIDNGVHEFGNLLLEIRAKAPNYKSLLDELVIALHDIALYQLIGRTDLEVFSFNKSLLENYAQRINPQQVQLYYQIVLEGLQEYQYAADGRSAFEMTLLRLMAFNPVKKKFGDLS